MIAGSSLEKSVYNDVSSSTLDGSQIRVTIDSNLTLTNQIGEVLKESIKKSRQHVQYIKVY